MARRRYEPKATFSDMPARLQHVDPDSPDSLKEEQAQWLEEAGLSFIGFIEWKREQNSAAKSRPPARRKLLTPEQVAALDAERAREGSPW